MTTSPHTTELAATHDPELPRDWDGPTTLTAAAHTGAMIALVPTDDDLDRLVVDGGEERDELHCTLAYLGEAADIPIDARDELVELVREYVGDLGVVHADGFGIATFNPPGTERDDGLERETCVVLVLSGAELQRPFSRVRAALEDHGGNLPEQHRPWIPHVTLVYSDDADPAYFYDRTGPVAFDRVRIAFGDEVLDLPLGESEVLVANFDLHQPRDDEGRWSDSKAHVGTSSLPPLDVKRFDKRFRRAKSEADAHRHVPAVSKMTPPAGGNAGDGRDDSADRRSRGRDW